MRNCQHYRIWSHFMGEINGGREFQVTLFVINIVDFFTQGLLPRNDFFVEKSKA